MSSRGDIRVDELANLFLKEFEVSIEDTEIQSLQAAFDTTASGVFQVSDIIGLFRGSLLKPRAVEMVQMLYGALMPADAWKDFVTEEEVERNILGLDLARTLDGTLSAKEVSDILLAGLRLYENQNYVDEAGITHFSVQTFMEYYRDVYAEVQDDIFFEKLIRCTWGV